MRSPIAAVRYTSKVLVLFTMLLTCSITTAYGQTLRLMVPDVPDSATQTYIDAFLSSDLLSEQDISAEITTYRQLSTPREALNDLMNGTVDLAILSSSLFAPSFQDADLKGTALISQPGTVQSLEQKFLLEDSVVGDIVAMELGMLGIVFLSFVDSLPTSLATMQRISGDANIRGIRFATIDPRSPSILAHADAVPITIAAAEIQTALRTGDIEGAELIVDQSAEQRLQSFHGGTLLANFHQKSAYLLANVDSWRNLSEAQRYAIQTSALVAQRASREAVQHNSSELSNYARSLQMEYVSIPDSRLAITFRDAAISAWKEAFPTVENEGVLLLEHQSLNTASTDQLPDSAPTGSVPACQDVSTPDIYFVSTRSLENHDNLRWKFGIEQDENVELHCGKLDYQTNPDRSFGRPFVGQISLAGGELISGIQDCVSLFTEAAENHGRRLTFFVHGYNNTFSTSISQVVSIAEDLKLRDPIVLWAWPSEGTKSGYVRDIAAVEFNRIYVREVIKEVKNKNRQLDISLLTHSMGGSVGIDFFGIFFEHEMKIANTVFVAVDIPQPRFKQGLKYHGNASSLTSLYTNANDRALYASRFVTRLPPAGLAGDALLVVADLDTIDVSAVDAEFFEINHSHAFDVPMVAADASHLLCNRVAAARRPGLTKKWTTEALPYYTIDDAGSN